jgi:uncharacterized 2Fe-2S/4Fe-4S cluster protein (DUF4445 family)
MTVTFNVEGSDSAVVPASAGESLLEIAQRAGVALDAPCGGQGTCGKCRLKFVSGEVDVEPSKHLTDEEFAAGWRLACRTKIKGDTTVSIPAEAQAFQSRIRITDFSGPREAAAFDQLRADLAELGRVGDHGLTAVDVTLTAPTIDDAQADRERLLTALSEATGAEMDAIRFTLFALRSLPLTLRENDYKVTAILRDEDAGKKTILNILPQKHAPLAGLAIDIGTTTVAMLLVNLETGNPLSHASGGNAQIRYGADVINRIIESTKKGGLERLRKAIVDECLSSLIKRLCLTAEIDATEIYRVTVAGNTTMTHLFTAVPPEYLRLEPYIPAFFHTDVFDAGALRLPVNPDAEVLCAPAVGSYVGGDITAGVFSAGFSRKEPLTLFIDLGTNGEIVFGNSDYLMCCACSAGPAFEGGEISCGMRATVGAVEAVSIDEKTQEPTLSVIGGKDAKPIGLCGSGLIDIIGELFRCHIVNAKGKFDVEGKRITRDEHGTGAYILAFASESGTGQDITLTEVDLDSFIRAKGAIFSAIRTMMAYVDAPIDAIERAYIAGGIGSGINIANAIRIGMFPKLPEERYVYIGNSSLSGAYAMLTSKGAANDVTEVANKMTYLELSTQPGYMDEFTAACFLPHTDASLFE